MITPFLAMTVDPWILAFSLITVSATIFMGFWSARQSRTASDFFVAGRSVSVGWNASAISGEYLSAASFMGIAGMVMKNGYDALWYPVCYACGYLFLLLFIAGPLRRFGAYTIPDFAEGRYDSPIFRKVAVIFVLFIGFFYTMPQMKGAGTTLAYIFPGLDYRWGVILVGAVITLNVSLGGMKGITLVQAFQYWAKMFAISVPIFVLMAVYGNYGSQLLPNAAGRKPLPATAPADTTWGSPFGPLTTKAAKAANASPRFHLPPEFRAGLVELLASQSPPTPPTAAGLSNVPVAVLVEKYASLQGAKVLTSSNFPTRLVSYPTPAKEPTAAEFKSGLEQTLTREGITVIPGGTGEIWAVPTAELSSYRLPPVNVRALSLLYTYSLIIALVCGTAGLPHILVRFYTNPDGVAAKRTTMWVMILIGIFYVFPPIFGVLGRNLLPELYSAVGAKGTDKVVLELPSLLNQKVPGLGSVLSGITCAGAFAAFMSTFSGLLVSMTGALAHDVYGRILRPQATPAERMRAFKFSAVIIGIVAILLGMRVEKLDINFMVGQAFAIAAASYFPLLFLSAWWRGMTVKGAATGMLVGGLLALVGVSLTSFTDLKVLPLDAYWAAHPLARILCEQPAIWAVPLAILLMIVVSKLTARDIPADVRMKMLVLHAPEQLGLKQEYIQEHQGH